ncbi:major facilitator superfamily domain-containing protein [Dendryphion nanum]|uniref:Major facilitator superfamily domain-containing protein n=1 Tax=Dendryphion nanum TaxID=256645 RepID=A0A9P9DKX9_9PLEO|nr:major facilitator superfamily domain-containing protein [Dendryphion nanum]
MTERRLPVKQLVILSICRFAEPIALTSVLPYLPEMVESFGIPKNDIARWAGLASATFSLSQGLTGIPWGIASDRFGRKPIILIGLINTMITTLMWGFSTSLPMAITARALQGLMNGNVGIMRTTVAELCPWKELQPRAFSIMPLVYTLGAIVGPTLGGTLSNPLGTDPTKPRGSKFFERFPYSLPNLVGSAFFMLGIVTGFLFLKETLETKKYEPDYGLMLGNRIATWVRKIFNLPQRHKKIQHGEHEPLLGPKAVDEEIAEGTSANPIQQYSGAPSMREVLTYQTSLNLFVYTLLAMYSLAYDQLLPVFMHHTPQSINDPNVKLPFKFAGGFGIGSRRIGAIFTVFSISTTLAQFLLFPPLAQRLGVLRCLRIAFLIFPFVFFVTPFTSLLPNQNSKEIAMVILLMIRGIGGTFGFPTSTIMLTNSASSLRILGTLNGLATSVSALGRGAGPATGGVLFTIGVKHGYIILPFWTLTLISLLAFIPTLWLVEGKGFGDDPDSDVESVVSASASSAEDTLDEEDGKSNNATHAVDILSESEYGEPTNLLSYTSTRSSAVVASDEEGDFSDDDVAGRHSRERRGTSNSLNHTLSRSHSRRVRRRSSVPVGMGTGFRRLSSNLGSTGIGPGTSWGGT